MRARVLLPATAAAVLAVPAAASAAFIHTVMPGESLSSVAAADGLSVAQLAAANGLPLDAQLIAGSSLSIPPQGASIVPAAPSSTDAAGDGDGDEDAAATSTSSSGSYVVQPGDTLTAIAARAGLTVSQLAAANGIDPAAPLLAGRTLVLGGSATAATAVPVSTTTSGSYVVQPGDTLTAIAARAGLTVSQLAAANGIDPAAPLLAGRALVLGQAGTVPPAPSVPPAVGTTVTGRMTWFGGPSDPNAQGVPASGLGWRSDGMAYFNAGSLRGHWLIRFPWGQTLPMTQIDLGPAPWTGNPFDIAFSALPGTPYSSQTWPNPTVTGTYEGP